ncbi:MAG: Lrp/AsnC ligand binding domain-containing protein [Candidatus Cloacimonetes bacterium]|nr:Lrp/AsnC ligand binding domain-containing protein [Candidatus Cloacimonadota bacterium]
MILDKLDKDILKALLKDSRTSFEEIARHHIVSGGTIHVRVNKMKEAGIIQGSKIIVDAQKLGFGVCCYIGINLLSARDSSKVTKLLEKLPEVVECHYTTGQYSLFVKIMVEDTRALHIFLAEQLQSIPQIQSTDTLISLDCPIQRDISVE